MANIRNNLHKQKLFWIFSNFQSVDQNHRSSSVDWKRILGPNLLGKGSPYASFYLSNSFFSVCSVFLIFKYSETLSFLPSHSLLMYLSQYDFHSLIMNSFSPLSVLFVDFLTILLVFFLYTCFFLLSHLFFCHIQLSQVVCPLQYFFLLYLFLNIVTLLLPFISDIYTQLCSPVNPFNKYY